MKREGRPQLSKRLKPGELITIARANDRRAWDAKVKYAKGSAIVCRFEETITQQETWWNGSEALLTVRRKHNYTVKRRDEGVTRARGWDTSAAHALKTVVAIRGLDETFGHSFKLAL